MPDGKAAIGLFEASGRAIVPVSVASNDFAVGLCHRAFCRLTQKQSINQSNLRPSASSAAVSIADTGSFF